MPTNIRDYYVFIGSYRSAQDEGVNLFRFNSGEGILQRISGTSGIENPSFLALDLDRRRIFAVSETVSGGAVVSLLFDPVTGSMTEINRQPSYGDYPCHLNIDASGNWLLVTNYMSGSVCVYPIEANGAIGPLSDQVHHVGYSVTMGRQESPHPHSIYPIPSISNYIVSDLGTDTLYTYRLDTGKGKLMLQNETKVEEGAGPRHLAFHPLEPYVYLIQELSSCITVFELNPDTSSLTSIQTVSTLPENLIVKSTCAEIMVSPSGQYVYGSNRGHNSIAVFRVLDSGRLKLLGHTSSGGQTPRNFAIVPDGSFLLVGNQNSNSIIVMKIRQNGIPVPTGERYDIWQPTCLKIVRMPIP